MKKNARITLPNGATALVHEDLKKKLNLSYLELTNKTYSAGKHNLPALACNTKVLPDFIALDSQPSTFHATPLTAVGFWEFDSEFDGIHGLYNAIYYKDEKLLAKFKKRYEGVKIFFTPDYSQLGDVDDIEAHYRLKKARVVGLWFALELGAVVIPFITAPTAASVEFALDGLEDCHIVAFSTKGYVDNALEREVLKEIVRLTVDTIDLHTIVVYDVCKDNAAVKDIFAYAIEHGIEVVVPPNTLKQRNIIKAQKAAEEKAPKAAAATKVSNSKGGDTLALF